MALRGDLSAGAKLPLWQETLITTIFNAITNNYIFPANANLKPEVFKKMLLDNFLRINAEHPNADKQKFCSEVNEVLKKIDPHLILQYDPAQIADHKEHKRIIDDPRKNNCARFALDGLDPPDSWFEKFSKENYGFEVKPEEKSFTLSETIGYVKINDFLDPRDKLGRLAEAKAHEILKGLQGKKAIIIDLRNSHGGSPEMVEFMMSYLLSESEKAKIKDSIYNTIDDYSTSVSREYKVRPTEFTLNVPICVLTNKNTFSAAEEFAYDIQQLNKHALRDNRCIVIGQTTKGGAHPMAGFPLLDPATNEINSEYFLWVPTRNAVNPYTKTNWEDGPKKEGQKPGVVPDIELPEKKNALEVAVARISSLTRTEELSSTAKAINILGIQPQELKSTLKENRLLDSDKKESVDLTVDEAADEINDEEMAKSAFGQSSDTAKKLRP
jgi:C-terminal processing protease CtpA/Prc